MTVSRWKRVKQEMAANSIGANGDEEYDEVKRKRELKYVFSLRVRCRMMMSYREWKETNMGKKE